MCLYGFLLEQGVPGDPRGRPIASFDHNHITPYILYLALKLCLKGYWDRGEIYCVIHLMIQGF